MSVICEVEDCIYRGIYGKRGECTIPSSITISNAGGLFIAGCGYYFKKDDSDIESSDT